MTKTILRNTRPCDGCARQKVRCELMPTGGEDKLSCHQCCELRIQCTFLRPQGKRGPKGRRSQTARKISSYQQHLANTQNENTTAPFIESPKPEDRSPRVPLAAYTAVLNLFRKQLFSVWPIIDCQRLLSDLEHSEIDNELYALAAAICAGSLAQLRIPEGPAEVYVSAARFEQEAQYHRNQFEYREMATSASLLTSLFLHMFYANNHIFPLAEWYLREAVLYTQRLLLHNQRVTSPTQQSDQELQLRIYWVIYVTERTFCAQHNLEAILDPISALPQPIPAEHPDSPPISGLVILAQMFSFLHKDVLRSLRGGNVSGGSRMSQSMLSKVQSRLSNPGWDENQVNEVQRVDLVMTRSWIRTLLWQYTLRHYPVYRNCEDKAFSSFLPKAVAKDLLVALSSPKEASLRAHGYGMELKLFKIADSLLDVLACGSEIDQAQSLHYGSRDILSCLERNLLIVGGEQSSFLKMLHRYMQEMGLKVPFTWWPPNNSEPLESTPGCQMRQHDRFNNMPLQIEDSQDNNLQEDGRHV